MNAFHFLVLVIVISGHGLAIQYNVEQESKLIITAIEDNGCASYQSPAPEHKQRIKLYNLDSLKGNK